MIELADVLALVPSGGGLGMRDGIIHIAVVVSAFEDGKRKSKTREKACSKKKASDEEALGSRNSLMRNVGWQCWCLRPPTATRWGIEGRARWTQT